MLVIFISPSITTPLVRDCKGRARGSDPSERHHTKSCARLLPSGLIISEMNSDSDRASCKAFRECEESFQGGLATSVASFFPWVVMRVTSIVTRHTAVRSATCHCPLEHSGICFSTIVNQSHRRTVDNSRNPISDDCYMINYCSNIKLFFRRPQQHTFPNLHLSLRACVSNHI